MSEARQGKPKLLVADDEASFLLPLRDNLEIEGYSVEVAKDGQEALAKAIDTHPDLILLDIMMPKMDGLQVCQKLQEKGVLAPIIILSARDQEVDIVLGLERGADDYITKPFKLRELLARIKAILRRQQKLQNEAKDDSGMLRIGAAEVDFRGYQVFRKGKKAQLTPREFAVLRHLWDKKNQVVSRDDLLNEVWGYDSFPTTRTVDNHIARLRKVIEEQPKHPKLLLSVRTVGYKLQIDG
jgi:DNA-binding response OmpR family regulator